MTIDEKTAKRIRDEYPWPRRGFGSIPVKVAVGQTRWKTSIFPDKEAFGLPPKEAVREREKITAGVRQR